jgi:phage baseplate assembly protein W
MAAIAYRTGIDRTTGKPLVGWMHVQQSLAVIWTTRVGERVMRLTFGSNLRSWLSEDINAATALGIYDELITAAHQWEPEYRITEMQLVKLVRDGVLGLRHAGIYYPEGRLGNYGIAQAVGGSLALAGTAIATRGRAINA